MQATREFAAWRTSGLFVLLLSLALLAGAIALAAFAPRYPSNLGSVLGVAGALLLAAIFGFKGLFMVQPNIAQVLTLFGRFYGTVRASGLHWSNPFVGRQGLSLRVRNFNSERLKVNDSRGNPIEIGAVVVWRITDTGKAAYDVQSVQEFVSLQAEAAIRAMASRYPYDHHDEPPSSSLRGNPDEVADAMRRDVQERLGVAGVEVVEARISHLAYAPEIAQSMLRRQQAEAIVAARTRIVEGAVGMVEMALHHIESKGMVKLDDERKAAMVNNLLVAIVSEREAQPVINAGTLYS